MCHSAVVQSTKNSPASTDLIVARRIAKISPLQQRSSPLKINPNISIIEAGIPTTIIGPVYLFGRATGYKSILQITGDGTVNGTNGLCPKSKYGKSPKLCVNIYC